jgi:hypothetical protein
MDAANAVGGKPEMIPVQLASIGLNRDGLRQFFF